MAQLEINKDCENMRFYIQSQFDLKTKKHGIIGVTFNRDLNVYDFYLNTNRIASHRASVFPRQHEQLKTFLASIASTAVTIIEFPRD